MKTTKLIIGLLFTASSGVIGQTLNDAIKLTTNEQFESADAAFKTLILSQPNNGEYYFYEDSIAEANLFYPERIQVTYIKKVPENAFLIKYELPMNIGVQTSFLHFNKPIIIRQNGFYYNQEELVNQGYWSWKNIADQLPYDYEPKNKE